MLALIDKGKVAADLPHLLGRAGDADGAREVPRLPQDARARTPRAWSHSSYFIRGYAIHGYASVPPYNASHGCLRVPVPNARSIYDWLRIGDVVWVEP